MNKTLLALAVTAVAAAIGVVAPKFVAPEHQKQLAILVDKINENPSYKAEILSTESGWFGSKNTISFGIDTSSTKELDSSIFETELEVNTTYGPFLFSGQGFIGLFESTINIAGKDLREALVWDEETPFYEVSFLGGFDGGLTFADHITEFTDAENLVSFSGYQGEGSLDQTSFSYNGKMSSFISDSSIQTLSINDISISMNGDVGLESMMEGGFYNSTMDITLADITVGSDIQLTGLRQLFATSFDEQSQLGTIQFGYSLDGFKYPSFEGSNFMVMSELNNLSNQYFLDLTKRIESNPNLSSNEALALMREGLSDLFLAHPEFNITDFRGTFPEGSFNGHLTSKLADLDKVTFEDLIDEAFWKYNAIVNANVEADEALIVDLGAKIFAHQSRSPDNVEQFKPQVLQMINALIQQGFIKQENGKYFSELSVQDGEGKINDVVFPL